MLATDTALGGAPAYVSNLKGITPAIRIFPQLKDMNVRSLVFKDQKD